MERVVPRAETETSKIFGTEVLDDGLEAVVAASGAFLAEAGGTKWQVEIVADDEEVF